MKPGYTYNNDIPSAWELVLAHLPLIEYMEQFYANAAA